MDSARTPDPVQPSTRPGTVLAAVVLLAVDATANLVSIGFTPYDGINIWDCGALFGTVSFAGAAGLAWLLWRGSARVAVAAWVWSLVLIELPFCCWLGSSASSDQMGWRLVAMLGAVMVVAPAVLLTLPLTRWFRH